MCTGAKQQPLLFIPVSEHPFATAEATQTERIYATLPLGDAAAS